MRETFALGISSVRAPRVLLAFALSLVFFVALLLPRAADSRFLPLPKVDHARLAQIDRIELSRFSLQQKPAPSASAERMQTASELSVGVRTVGELFRRSGRLLSANAAGAEASLRELRVQFRHEVERGKTEELLALRSLQSQLFVRALADFDGGQSTQRELEELGGDVVRVLEQGWLGWQGSTRKVLVDDAALRLIFRVRWGILVGCHREVPFGPSLEEQRGYYSLYLRHPPVADTDEAALALARIPYATALGQVDPSFPVDLALGSLLLQAGLLEGAAAHLRAYLARPGSERYGTLARSYLLFATNAP